VSVQETDSDGAGLNDFPRRREKILTALQAGRSFDFEHMLEQHYRRFLGRGDGVIDVGAHTGRHLVNFIECVGDSGHIIAFEPLPFAYEHLRARYRRANVVLKNAALSDTEGVVSFVHAQGTPEESGLRERAYNSPDAAKPRVIEVAAEKLDRYVDAIARLKYIKIDVEGGEMNVLSGGARMLSVHRPLVSVEYGRPGYSAYGHTLFTLFDFAEANDYVMYDIFANRLGREQWPQSCDSICWDFFMVPAEKEADFARLVPPVVVD
jgi:FkbM family methyltransferase